MNFIGRQADQDSEFGTALRGPGSMIGGLGGHAAGQAGRGPENRVIIGTGVAGLLAALSALSLAAAVDQWAFGMLLAGLAMLVASGVVTFQLLRKAKTPAIVDRSLLVAAMESDLGRVVTDRAGNLVCANQTYRRLCFGRVPAPIDLGKTDPKGRQALAAIQSAVDGTGEGRGVAVLASRGRQRTLELSAQAQGNYILWTVRRADSGHLLQEAIREIKLRLQPLMDGLGLGFVVRDPSGKVLHLNDVALSQLDVPEDKRRQLEWSEIQNDEGGFRRISDGSPLLIETVDFPLPGLVDGQDIGVLTLIRPPRRRATGTGVSSVFEEAPLGVAIVDPDMTIRQFNSAFAEQFGKGAGQRIVEGTRFDQLVAEEDKSDVELNIRKAAEGTPQMLPIELHLGGDRENIAQVYFSTLGEGGEARAVLYAVDTTEQKSLETQFALAMKMQAVGQLAGGIAHDFNNLLTAIIGFCDLLLVRHGPGDQSFSDLMQIKQNANRAANLVRQLLAFSRRQTLRPKVLMATDVLAELSNLIRRLIGEKIELKMVHGRGLGAIKVDQGQLEQVIINLAVNARDAMHDGGRLEISTRNVGAEESGALGYKVMPGDDYVLISVADTGTGIPEQNIDKLFEPFFTTKEIGKGTGLGLSTVYGIVKQTGGFIFARNNENGPGATFDIYLPVYRATHQEEEQAPDSAEEAPARDLTGKETILIAEDEDAVRLFASRALSNKGYTVLDCASGEAALDALDTHDGPIHLLISDVVMPGLDGPTLVEKARNRFPNLKVILISGYAEEAFQKKLDASDFAFIPKPFSLQVLAERVREVLEE